MEETGHVALPLKSAASTENKLVQGMHAVRATLVQKCPPAPPRTGKAGADSERMRESQMWKLIEFASKELGFHQTERVHIFFLGFHRHYFRDNTTGDDFDEYSWLASLSTADILTPVEPATYSLAWAIALTQAKMAVFPTAARRYSGALLAPLLHIAFRPPDR